MGLWFGWFVVSFSILFNQINNVINPWAYVSWIVHLILFIHHQTIHNQLMSHTVPSSSSSSVSNVEPSLTKKKHTLRYWLVVNSILVMFNLQTMNFTLHLKTPYTNIQYLLIFLMLARFIQQMFEFD